ncbi:MAG TPA: NADPH-dependent FMN reductase [Gaiellaceae bacterium]|nr:NADPH-dependent FMN reductase [Gaiellaceae bacterium]
MKLLAVSGSLREGSYNTALAELACRLAPAGVEASVYDRLAELPLYDADRDGEEAPESVRAFRKAVAEADAVLFVTPEYNGSVSGVLKNAVDWASRPPHGGAALWGKTVAVAGATTGQYGAIWAQQDLRRILGIAGARVLPGELPVARAQEAFTPDGRLRDRRLEERLRDHVRALVDEAAAVPLAA